MSKNEIILISTFFLFLFFVPSTYAVEYSEKMEQIFTFNESDIVHVKFIDTINISEGSIASNSFRFHKSMEVSNFHPYDLITSELLNYTITDAPGNFSRITINFPSYYTSYTFVFEFDYKNPYETYSGINRFYWNWGNAGYPIELKYIFRLPPNNLVTYSSKDYKTVIEEKSAILIVEGIAPMNESFNFLFDFKKADMPNIFINKISNKNSIVEDETIIVKVKFFNIGESIAKNLTVKDSYPGIFTLESGDIEWSGDLEAGHSQSFEYTLRAKASVDNKPLGKVMATYKDFWGSDYKSESVDVIISIEEAPVFLDFGFVRMPVPFKFSQLIIYNFFIGYGILMWIFLLKRTEGHKTWNKIPFFDKIIYSLIAAGVNGIFVFFFYVLIALLIPQLLLVKNIEYAIFLIPMYMTVQLLSKKIERIGNKTVVMVFYILVFLLILLLIS